MFKGESLKPGTHINAAGSNFLIKRELDETCIRRCRSIVVDSKDQARMECGEFLGPSAERKADLGPDSRA